MKTTRLASILFILAAFFAAFGANAAETATQLLSKCAAKVDKSPSVTIKFRLAFGNRYSDCTMILAKDKYRLSSSDMEVWYDGKTQWTYAKASKELSITEPTTDELLECNPFAILKGFSKIYNCRRLGGPANDIELTSKVKGSAVKKAVVSIDSKTSLPTKLVVTLSNGRTFSATVSSTTAGKALPASTFTYDKSKFPAKEIVDLR